jgi:hypothetical protein
MRTTKELLELMLEKHHVFGMGLCACASRLWYSDVITWEELEGLRHYLKMNKPIDAGIMYWWELGEIQPRIDWINEQIKLLSNDNNL